MTGRIDAFIKILSFLLSIQMFGFAAFGQVALTPIEDSDATKGYSLNFGGESLENVLQAYGAVTGKTALIDPGAKAGNITLKSQSDLTREEYLDAIKMALSMHGVALINSGKKFVKVVPIKDAQKESMEVYQKIDEELLGKRGHIVSQLIALKHITTKEAEGAIKALKHDYAAVHSFERTNSILITDTAENIKRIILMISYLDQPIERREEHHIIPVKYARASEIKAKLEEIIKQTREEETQSKVPRPRESGSPGYEKPEPRSTPRGVIRPPKEASKKDIPVEVEEILAEADRGIIRGLVNIIADDRTNVLIFITRPENMSFFEKIVSVLDRETEPDVLVKVIRLEYAEAETVAKTLNTLIGQQKNEIRPAIRGEEGNNDGDGRSAALREYVANLERRSEAGEIKSKVGELSSENIKILPDQRTNSLLIMASRGDLATLEEILENMDMMLSQVLIEAVIIQVDLNDNIQSGIQWIQKSLIAYEEQSDGTREALGSIAGSAGSGSGDVLPAFAEASDLTTLENWGGSSGLTTYFTHFGLNLTAIARMVSTDSRSKILSAPVIVTTDNTEGIITSSEQRYFLKGSTVDQFGNVRPETEIKDIGLELHVTPHINQSKNVMMEISQEVSDLGPEQQIEGQGSWPTTKKRSFNSSIMVQDRETVILGGLVRNFSSKDRRKVPLLGDIPLLGSLFRFQSSGNTRGEVVVFITPYVLDSEDSISSESMRRRDSLNMKGIWERGWSDSDLAEDFRNSRELEDGAKSRDDSEWSGAEEGSRSVDRQTMEFIRSQDQRSKGVIKEIK